MLNVGDKLICKTEGQPETEFCIRGEVKKVEGDIVTISRALKFGTLPMQKDLTLPESELLKYYAPLDNRAQGSRSPSAHSLDVPAAPGTHRQCRPLPAWPGSPERPG